MARPATGYFVLQRARVSDDPHVKGSLYGNGPALAVYAVLHAWAAWEDGPCVKRGQVATTLAELIRATGVKKMTLRRTLLRLASEHICEHTSDHTGIVITLREYNQTQITGQPADTDLNTPVNTPVNTPLNTQVNTIYKQESTKAGKQVGRKPLRRGQPDANGKEKSLGARVWEAYAAAYEKRYDQKPVSNARQYAMTAQLGGRLGEGLAEAVAAFFVAHCDAFYVKNMHPLWLAVRDAEKLAIECRSGRQMTSAIAHETERTANNRQSADLVLDMLSGGGSQ